MKIPRSKRRRRVLPRIVVEVERGQALVLLALAMVGLIAFSALSIDGGNAFLVRRNMQNAADGGVIAAVQAYLETKTYGGNIEAAILQAAHASAEVNGVEDEESGAPGTAFNCVNDNVFVWYIDGNGDVIEPSTGTVQTGVVPNPHDTTAMTYRISTSDCGSAGTAPDFSGIHVSTRREFGTFFAQVVGRNEMTAEGSAAVLVSYSTNTCAGEYAMLGFDSRPQGTVKLTGEPPPNCVEIDGDIYSADKVHFGGGGCIKIDGFIHHVNGFDVAGGMDIWFGPILEAGGPIDDVIQCDDAPDPSKWTFDDTTVGSGVELCIYNDGRYASGPFVTIPPIEDPYNLKFSDWDIKNDGPAAYDASGCWMEQVGCYNGLVTIGGSTWEKWGNDYYYYADSGDWGINGTTSATPIPNGVYFLPNDGIQSNDSDPNPTYVSPFITIVASDVMTFTGDYYIIPPLDLGGNPNSWKPYGGANGYGVLLFGNFDNLSANGNAIVFSGVQGDTEGIIYAPLGDCQFSGTGLHSGGIICEHIDSSGSTPSVSFNFGYCPYPHPTITIVK